MRSMSPGVVLDRKVRFTASTVYVVILSAAVSLASTHPPHLDNQHPQCKGGAATECLGGGGGGGGVQQRLHEMSG